MKSTLNERKMMTVSLECYHSEGRDELLDLLADGALLPAQQSTLWKLLQPFNDSPTFFNPWDVIDYELEPAGDNTATQSWACPVCGHTHRDLIDIYEVV